MTKVIGIGAGRRVPAVVIEIVKGCQNDGMETSTARYPEIADNGPPIDDAMAYVMSRKTFDKESAQCK